MFETLLALVGDNAEAKTEIAKIKGKFEEKDTVITSLQGQFDSVKTEKDKYKMGNQLLKTKLGIDKIDEETVTKKLTDLTSKGDKSKELQELTDALASKDDEINGIKQEYENKFTSMRVDNELSRGLEDAAELLADDPMLRSAFRDIVSKQIGVVGDAVAPYTVVGDQRVPVVKDGNPVSVGDYVKGLLEDEKFASFRKPTVKGGNGGTGGSSNNGGKTSDLTGSSENRSEGVKSFLASQGLI